MDFHKSTILGLFDSSQRSYTIPVYQRAYSWDKEQWSNFLEDLEEQIDGNNNYFYGKILLETIKKDVKYEVINGQQRLTTLVIFIRSAINLLMERSKSENLDDFDFDTKRAIYLKTGGNIKLRPVEYDRAFYDSIIIDNYSNFPINSPSQKRIKTAKEYFTEELKKKSTNDVLKILEKIEQTEIAVIELTGKKDSALIFELENNRGKDLTNMEKIKSYFMYQMYVFSNPDEVDSNIEHISNIFVLIYQIINDLKYLNEDSILLYHNSAYIKGYNYRTLDDLKEMYKKAKNKISWIKAYLSELHTTFSNLKKFESTNDYYAFKLKELGMPVFVYPFVIRGYKYVPEDSDKLSTLFHILEIVTFRAKLINSRANIQERLNALLLEFKGDVPDLAGKIKNKLNESWYWGDSNMKNYLNGGMYGNNVLNYLLWQYENSIQNKGY